MKIAFFEVDLEPYCSKSFKYLFHVLLVFGKVITIDKYIIHISGAENVKVFMKSFVDVSLELG